MSQRPRVTREPFFLPTSRGARFAIALRTHTPPVGGLLYLHPFAEEMNKARRMASLAAEAFAARGWLVLQVDCGGCGDSEGDFAAADWQGWLGDVADAWAWLRARCESRLCLWTLRAGSLLAADWLASTAERPALLLWQPVTSGSQHLNQFLRLKAASEIVAMSGEQGGMARVRAELEETGSVEVAGYRLSQALATGLAASSLKLPVDYRASVAIVEVASRDAADVSPAVAALATRWRDAGAPVAAQVVQGPSFWHTQEIETVPALIEVSLQALDRLAQ